MRTIAQGKLQLGWRILIQAHPKTGVVSITIYRRLFTGLEIHTGFTMDILRGLQWSMTSPMKSTRGAAAPVKTDLQRALHEIRLSTKRTARATLTLGPTAANTVSTGTLGITARDI